MSRLPIAASLVALSAAFAVAAAPASAQQPGSRQTREFVQAAAQSDQFEIMEGTTVLAQSQNPRIRAFAQAMIDAHTKTTASLLQAVSKAGLAPPLPGLGNDQSQFLAALQSQRGADLDKAYVRQQALAHHAALTVEQTYADTGDDPAIRAAAAATVPIVTEHLRMVEQMREGGRLVTD